MLPIIRFERVTKQFGANVALNKVSFEVAPGTVFALLGENGAGKTTAIRTLLGFVEPDEGHSFVLGFDCQKESLAIRQRVGYVPEQPTLYDWMTVAEIGRFAAAFYPDKMEFWNRYQQQIATYQLPPQSRIKSLSKGMRAKVSLALALACDPELLILDEPTSGLDALIRREFLDSMIDRAATGKTVFLSSHQIAEVERVADTVAIMKKSRLLLVEPLATLKESFKLLTAVMTDTAIPASLPFETVVQQRQSGRQLQVLGRNWSGNIDGGVIGDNLTHCEIRTPTLEEIFVGIVEE